MPPTERRISLLSKNPAPLQLRAAAGLSRQLAKNLNRFPQLVGNPIFVSTRPTLTVHRGRLVSTASGSAVYAAAFLRQRKIILEDALFANPEVLRLILVHELFHFVWPRLGKRVRQSFSTILSDEWKKGARGELGESAGVRKALFEMSASTRVWRDYLCESFCDTAAWLYAGVPDSSFFTLRPRWRERRRTWFEAVGRSGPWKC